MTTRQRITILADWWPAACETQRWNKNDRPLRLQIISQAVGRPIGTMSDLDNTADIDQVKAYLGYLADNLDGAREKGDPEPGERRRYLWLIRRHSHTLGGEPYALSIARDRFHTTAGLTTIDDLPTEQLRQLMMTLWARLVAHRRAAPRNAPSAIAPAAVEYAKENAPF